MVGLCDYSGRFGKIGPTRCGGQLSAVLARSDSFRDFPSVALRG